MLKGKKILLGVTGSIAAYKSATLIRLLKKEGAEVKVIATTSALAFIGPLTLSTLSENEVFSTFFDPDSGKWSNHVALGLWADLFVVAPLSANTLAKMANGSCDNLLIASYLSARCGTMVAPAMDLDMYAHPTTLRNLAQLQADGVHIIEAKNGQLASGLEGKGRMTEPEDILQEIVAYFAAVEEEKSFTGKKCLLTAGPTREYLDPVRYLSNASSGKMAYALANRLVSLGAEVTLVSGPVDKGLDFIGKSLITVTSAQEMHDKAKELFPAMDVIIFAAAVADYRPKQVFAQKIKKDHSKSANTELSIALQPNPDIAASLGKLKSQHQITIGFALETENEEVNALQKLARKNLDAIVLNSLNDKGAGFNHDTNKITIFSAKEKKSYPLKSKNEVAKDIADYVAQLFKEKNKEVN